VGDGQPANNAIASPPPTVGSEGSARVGDPRQSIVDRAREGLLYRETPPEEIPLSSLPVPGIDTSQSGPIARPGTFDRERSVYGQGSQGVDLSNGGATAPPEVPKRFDPSQPAGPPTAYGPDPRGEFSPYAPLPTSSRASSSWPDVRDATPHANSVASASGTLISDSGDSADDGRYFGSPNGLATAMGYKPWPRRMVSYDVEPTPVSAPKDFWSNLSEMTKDRSLAYLMEDAGSSEFGSPGTADGPSSPFQKEGADSAEADSPETAGDPPFDHPKKDADSTEGDSRWWPLTLAVLALFASMGGNLYMGWIVAGTYRKYLDLTDDVDGEDRHEIAEDEPEEESWVRRRSSREGRTAGV